MGYISEESIQRVAEASDIVTVIGSYFPLKRVGGSFRSLCPFHQEKTPSFYVHPGRQSFHCFGCGAGGGVFRFVMDYEHVDFPTAVRKLAERAGIALVEESDPHEVQQRTQRSRLLELHRKVTLWYQRHLLRSPAGESARAYLKERGLHQNIARQWQLGFAPSGWDHCLRWGESEGFSVEELHMAGLLSQGESKRYYDRFRNRVMFPICNDYGEVVGFSGRALSQEKGEPKYMNSPETPLFHKGKLLFGLHRSKRVMAATKEALLLEGQIDVITSFEHGLENVVAPQGTALTLEQARLLKRFVERVLLCFDADGAGYRAVNRALPILLSEGLEVRVLFLPPGEDPDSLLRKEGRDAFELRLGQAKDFFQERLDRAFKEQGAESFSSRQLAELAAELGGLLHLVPDLAYRELLRSEIAARLRISPMTLEKVPPRALEGAHLAPSSAPVKPRLKLSATLEMLLQLLWQSDAVVKWFLQQEWELLLEEEGGELFKELLYLKKEAHSDSIVLAKASTELQQQIAAWADQRCFEDALLVAQDTFGGMQVAFWKKKQAEKTAELGKRDLATADIIKIQQQILDLQQKINDVSRSHSLTGLFDQ